VNKSQKNQFKPRVEGLEQRALMSVSSTFMKQAGLLFVQGTAHGDTINIGVNSRGDVTVNGTDVGGTNSQVKYIWVTDIAGGDTITIGNVSGHATITALMGGDTINLNNSDTSKDWVFGGKGDKIHFAGATPLIFNMGYKETHVGAHEIDLG